MEVKEWTYEEIPEFTDIPEGADHGGPEFWTGQVIDLVDAFMKRVFG